MKNFFLILTALLILSNTNYAQFFTFERTSPSIVYDSLNSFEIKSYGKVKNLSGGPLTMNITLTNVNLPTSNWEVGMCTWVLCYATGAYNITEILPAGSEDKIVYVYFIPDNTTPGTASVRVTMTYGAQSTFQDFTVSTMPIGIKNISNVAEKFILNQNYPNPFNPVTKISFSIPKKELATLKVFDLLGRQVAELVNTELNAGQYEYDFDAKKLTSGMYYYSLRAGEYFDVKKMVLVK